METRIIAVTNQKGGVAKTTTALTLAAALARKGKRVLAIDLDPQANLTLGLGFDPRKVEGAGLYEVLVEDAPLESARLRLSHPELASLELVPGSRRLAAVGRELEGQPGFDGVLKEKLLEADDCDHIILDCPPALGVLTTNALVAAELALVPVQCEFFALSGLAETDRLLSLVRRRRNSGLRVKVLPTLHDRRNKICKGVLSELKSRFEAQLATVVIDVDTRLREAASKGTPVVVYAPKARATKQYESLAEEIVSHG